MKTGTIKKLVSDRGFAFIRADESDVDYFLHATDLQMPFEDLREGDRVTFESRQGPRGLRAANVRPA